MLWKVRTPEEIEAFIEETAETIVKKNMVEPAILFFESFKPIALVGGKLAGMTFAWLIPFMGHKADDYFVVFSEPARIEKLLMLIETKSKEKKEAKKNKKGK